MMLSEESGLPDRSIGWLEVALPLWHRRWRLLLAGLLGAAVAFGIALAQPVRFMARATFIVQPAARPSQSVVGSALPAVAGLLGAGTSTVDLHVAILRSQSVNDRVIDRFELQRVWQLPYRLQVQQRLARRVEFIAGRREGMVQIEVEDDHPQRAAAMADQYVEELRRVLRGFALDEARQRKAFYDTQLAQARAGLNQAQQKLQRSGVDRAALRAEPRTAADAYARVQAEIAAAEVRLAATRKVRSDDSPEVELQQTELAALRSQRTSLQSPRDDDTGAFIGSMRDFRSAEAVAESIARQAEAARVDEAADTVPIQVLDRAQVPPWPSSPRPLLWALCGGIAAFGLMATWVIGRHRQALARQDAAYQARLHQVLAALQRRGA
jgi:uncharacterized protein involved in exopolysaccharide biosynthesis